MTSPNTIPAELLRRAEACGLTRWVNQASEVGWVRDGIILVYPDDGAWRWDPGAEPTEALALERVVSHLEGQRRGDGEEKCECGIDADAPERHHADWCGAPREELIRALLADDWQHRPYPDVKIPADADLDAQADASAGGTADGVATTRPAVGAEAAHPNLHRHDIPAPVERWEVMLCHWAQPSVFLPESVDDACREGWEPFAAGVQPTTGATALLAGFVYLRRRVT